MSWRLSHGGSGQQQAHSRSSMRSGEHPSRRSMRASKKVVASMFSKSTFYHLPRRDSLAVASPSAASANAAFFPRGRSSTDSLVLDATTFHSVPLTSVSRTTASPAASVKAASRQASRELPV